jgi:protein involved in polysaccharide export with SLBB domain
MKFSGLWMRGFFSLFVVGSLAGCKSGSDPGFQFDPLTVGSRTAQPQVAQPQVGQPQVAQPTTAPGTNRPAQRPMNPLESVPILRVGDGVIVTFNDVITPIPPVDTQVKDDGTVTLNYGKVFNAAGRTLRQLESDIHETYVPAYFKTMTPTVVIKDRFFSVGGEVKAAGRQVYVGRMNVLQAIDAAGGFTDYSNKGKVIVTRSNGRQVTINARRALTHPELNIEIFPGDQVFVKKRWW